MVELMKFGFKIDGYCEHESRINSLPNKKFEFYLTKKPSDFLVSWLVLPFVRNMYVISVVRDPRDSVCSKRKDSAGRFWCSLKFWKWYTRLSFLNLISKRFIEIKYEDLCQKPNFVQDEISKAIPSLSRKHLFSEFGFESQSVNSDSLLALNGLRPLDSSSIGIWRKSIGRVAYQVQRHGDISTSLIKYKYEDSISWKRTLPNHWNELDEVTVSTENWTFKQVWKAVRSALSCVKNYYIVKKYYINTSD